MVHLYLPLYRVALLALSHPSSSPVAAAVCSSAWLWMLWVLAGDEALQQQQLLDTAVLTCCLRSGCR